MDKEKRYLEEGDEIVADFVYFTLTDNNELENPQLGYCSFWHDGEGAFKDEDGRFYVFEEVECIG
jgi:hypothetical protein